MSTVEDMGVCIDQLIEDHFPWGDDGHPPLAEVRAPAERRAYVDQWLDEQSIPYRLTALALMARVTRVVDDLAATIRERDGARFFYRLDETNLVKSPASILEKMARQWGGDPKEPPKVAFSQLSELKDVARFRVVANFLSDVQMIGEAIDLLGDLGRALESAGMRVVIAGSRDLDGFVDQELGVDTARLPAPFSRLARYSLGPLTGPNLALELRRVLIGTGLVPEGGELRWLEAQVDLAMPFPTLRWLAWLGERVAGGSNGAIDLDAQLNAYLATTDDFRDIEGRIAEKSAGGEEVDDLLNRLTAPRDVRPPRSSELDPSLLAWMTDNLPVQVERGRLVLVSRLFRKWWRQRQGLGP